MNLSELERNFYQQRVTGALPSTRLNEAKRVFFQAQLTTANNKLEDLEARWLRAVIVAKGATPSSTSHLGTLYREAVVALGVTPVNVFSENKRLFLINYS